MDGSRPFFAVLGIADGSSAAEVKRAFRVRAFVMHPDHGGDPDSFRRLRRAYEQALAARRASPGSHRFLTPDRLPSAPPPSPAPASQPSRLPSPPASRPPSPAAGPRPVASPAARNSFARVLADALAAA